MLTLLCTLRALAVSAIGPALVLTIATQNSNGPWRPAELAALAAQFWLLFAIVFAAPFVALAAIAAVRRRAVTPNAAWGTAVAVPFALLWYERVKPLELWTARYRPSAYDVIGLAAVVALTAAVARVATASSTRHPVVRGVGAALVASALLSGYVRIFEPSPDRSAPAARLAGRAPAQARVASPSSAPPRVLFIGVDGLDWNAVERLVAQHRLPRIERLLNRGRSYELDTGGLLLSPEIWTAIYTGRRPAFSGYVEWRVSGLSRPVSGLPPFGYRPMWGVNKWLWRTIDLGLWTPASISTNRMNGPAFWRIASAAGLDVAVFNPVPYEVKGEEVRGVFAWEHDEVYDAHWKANAQPSRDERVPFPGGFRETAAESMDVERRRSMLAGNILARAHPALGVYYTQTVDEISHWDWPSARDFDRSPIASAYEEVDRSIGVLSDRFGEPQTIVLASDHGWEFSPYQHSRVPHGMLVVAGAELSGFGGTAPVRTIAPTVLSLLNLPRDVAGASPLAGVPTAGVADYSTVGAAFLADAGGRPPDDVRQRLKSLGYIAW